MKKLIVLCPPNKIFQPTHPAANSRNETKSKENVKEVEKEKDQKSYTRDNSRIAVPDTSVFKIHAFHYYFQDFFGIIFMDPGSNTRVPSAGPAVTVQPAPRLWPSLIVV